MGRKRRPGCGSRLSPKASSRTPGPWLRRHLGPQQPAGSSSTRPALVVLCRALYSVPPPCHQPEIAGPWKPCPAHGIFTGPLHRPASPSLIGVGAAMPLLKGSSGQHSPWDWLCSTYHSRVQQGQRPVWCRIHILGATVPSTEVQIDAPATMAWGCQIGPPPLQRAGH